MAMVSKKERKFWQKKQKSEKKRHVAWGAVVFVLAILLLIASIDFSPNQTRFVTTCTGDQMADQNIVGEFGANVVFFSMRYFGFAAWLIPITLFIISHMLFVPETKPLNKGRVIALAMMFASATGLLEYVQRYCLSTETFLRLSHNKFSAGLGGTVGYFTFHRMAEKVFAATGSAILLFLLFILSSSYIFTASLSLDGALEKSIQRYGYFRIIIWGSLKFSCITLYKLMAWIMGKFFSTMAWVWRKIFRMGNKHIPQTNTNFNKRDNHRAEKPSIHEHGVSRGDYILPPIELLQRAKKTSSDDDHAAVSKQLVDTLAQFGIAVHAGEVHIGPVITRYEISPAPGVRVEKIVNLDKNIALNLRAQSVRILAPVPGRGCVGVELPNRNPQMVCLREILESNDWRIMKADIPIILGRGTTGEPMINDLSKMPHLLIAGATGSGKTVCINSIIASLVYHSTPDDLRFIMVDPKIVEMQVFNKLPHMLIPVVTDPKKVPNALKWLISEMELRYKIFARLGVRNIAGFNAKILKNADEVARAEELERSLSPEERSAMSAALPQNPENVDIPNQRMPYIVCIIDELADLMMVAPADIETCVARLAQLARAAGIHLILATQRPSVNVITGIIKANLPSRIAFKVASKVDSRTILDAGGAEALLGRGDMLFQPPGASGLLRAQGALVSDEEINKIVDFLHDKNGDPEYAMDIHTLVESGEDGDVELDDGNWEDDMIPRALEIIRSSDRASISFLQRKLKIGYNRAARIMETLEAKGLVSNQNNQSHDDNLD
ncbi:MAG: DNA translocase FtsK 4TM domain-containing protein [Puniceicoccales bacterium]|jgi:DNA segregation ATPase FtsK/SpoIIIE-like protein|nr:DNA translocase FtsK 4TM domain-containing protein [Puniceicoccales bacterium]